jgi:hypothetical protein
MSQVLQAWLLFALVPVLIFMSVCVLCGGRWCCQHVQPALCGRVLTLGMEVHALTQRLHAQLVEA